jgi:hypothetical protein
MSDPVSANPMPTVVPPSPDEGIITLNYDGSGLGWVDLWDNAIIAWVIDANDVSVGPSPRILGTFPPAPPDTSPVLTPSWVAITRAGNVFVPDTWRGTFYDFLTWLATNNGAQRKVIGNGLRRSRVAESYRTWATNHPNLALDNYPDEPATEEEARRRAQLGP